MKIAAVIVTFNRLEKLKKALSAYEAQVTPVDDLIVVDNYSTDGTRSFLKEWEKERGESSRHVIYMEENLGGSGGFHDGCQYAMNLNPDWIFVADDDAYPKENIFRLFCDYINENSTERLGAICATVINKDHTIALDHRSKIQIHNNVKLVINPSSEDMYCSSFDLDVFSYVGTFLSAKALHDVGVCEKGFFIYADDAEHSLRIRRWGRIVCLPQLKIFHDCGAQAQKDDGSLMSWRDYYLMRNRMFLLKRHYPQAIPYTMMLYVYAAMRTKSIACIKLTFTALFNGLISKLGKHTLYKPNYVIKK